MDLNNRTLMLLAAGTTALALLAYGLTFNLISVPTPEVPILVEDISPTIEVTKPSKLKLEDETGPVVIKADDPENVTTVMLQCGVYKRDLSFEKGQAVFTNVPPGTECTVTMRGTAQGYSPIFAGDTVTCMDLDQDSECIGGVAKDHPALLNLESDVKAEIYIDGDWFGTTPNPQVRVKPGRRTIKLKLPNGPELSWVRIFNPGESVRMHFPKPGGYTAPESDEG